MINWEVGLGNILTIVTILFAGASFYWRQFYDSRAFKNDIYEIKGDLKVLNKVVTDIALQNQRLDNQGERLNRLDKRLDELRHGKGFIE